MDSTAASWPRGLQDINNKLVKLPMEEIASSNNNTCSSRPPVIERKARPQEQLNCPRCNSTNTKFCYYNNYSLTQPRYFCKTCRRYWTEGGSLRNVPVGGGSRKNKRSSTTSSSSSAAAAASASSNKLPDLNPPSLSHFSSSLNPKNTTHEGQDLNLAFPPIENCPQTSSSPLSALELLRSGIATRGLNSFIPPPMPPDSNTLYSSSVGGLIPMQEFKPSLSFSVDGLGIGSRYAAGVQENNSGRLLFPFGELKQQLSSTTHDMDDQNKGQGASNYNGYNWNGMSFGGGSW